MLRLCHDLGLVTIVSLVSKLRLDLHGLGTSLHACSTCQRHCLASGCARGTDCRISSFWLYSFERLCIQRGVAEIQLWLRTHIIDILIKESNIGVQVLGRHF